MKPVQTIKRTIIISISLSMTLLMVLPYENTLAVQPQGADTIPSSILDPDSVAWASVRNMTSTQFSDHFTEMKDKGYMVIDIEVDEIDAVQRVGAVWQKNSDNRGWEEWRNLSGSEYQVKLAELRTRGYRLIDQETYQLGSIWYYAGAWIQNIESLEWISYVDQTSAEFSTLFQRYSEAGYLMIDVDAYETTGGMRYSAVWVDNSEGLGWVEYRDMTSAEFAQKFDELKGEYRMIDVESYQNSGAQRYAGIWVMNVNNRGWAEWRDLTAKGFGDKWIQLRDAGYRLINYEAYPTANGWRYAGIWRQNSDRPDWRLKDDVDLLLEGHAADFDIPGMSVAIAQNGNFLYLRGFGFADIDDAVIAQSRTIYRMASISKAVGGVLSMRLDEQAMLNLDAATSSYVPGLPAHHTHTVRQTISNRSGVGHYEDYPSVSGSYATALAAAQQIWDVPLVYTPGAGYKYSTHAYTFLGAALEGAVGDPVADILDDELRTPYNLNTLLKEDLSVPKARRATIYNTSDQEVTADDLSWKVLGGGLEASAYDLARFGIKLVNNTILTQASLDEMWTPPDNASKYALGWNTGTEAGTPVVAKDGAQNGSRCYIRIYPEKGIVIVVMTNRKNGGHSAVTLGKEIGELMLAAETHSQVLTAAPLVLDQAEDEDLEPEEEAIDPALVVWPVYNPVATPSPEDLQESEDEPVFEVLVYIPVVIR